MDKTLAVSSIPPPAGPERSGPPAADLGALLAEAWSPADLRRAMGTPAGWDPALWRDLADRGLLGLHLPTQWGGSGRPFATVAEVAEGLGAALAAVPYLSTIVLAATALVLAGDEEVACEHLPRIASGSAVATLAVTEATGRWEEADVRTVARPDPGGRGHYVLDGHKSYVVDGASADLVLVAAREAAGPNAAAGLGGPNAAAGLGGPNAVPGLRGPNAVPGLRGPNAVTHTGLFAVAGDAPGLTRTPLVALDLTRPLAHLELVAVPARRVGAEGDGWTVIAQVLDRAAVALAAEAVGGAQRCLDMAVAHACGRVQFGRPIGSFQAVQHKLADVLVDVEAARSVATAAAATVAGEQGDELPLLASTAKAYCSEAFVRAASESIQVHGGVGFTWDHDAHLYFKRARSSALLLGDPAWHRERVARLLGL